MAIASTPTLLSLDGFAKYCGINPVHFAGAKADGVWDPTGSCSKLWPQHPWMGIQTISREEIAQVLHSAEVEVANVLGYAPAPRFEEAENHAWPRDWDKEWGRAPRRGTNWRATAVNTLYGKVREVGRRKMTLLGALSTVTFSDGDGDGWAETATVTIATDATDPTQVKLYFPGFGTESVWEIRPLRSVAIDAGVATIKAPTWLFIDPNVWEVIPNSQNFDGIDITDTSSANLLHAVDVYLETVDSTDNPAKMYSSYSTTLGSGEERGGSFTVRQAQAGLVVPFLGSYSSEDAKWTEDCEPWIGPDYMNLWYRGGDVNPYYLRGTSGEAMPPHLAETVAILAASRLSKPVCGCSVLTEFLRKMQQDLGRSGRGSEFTFVTPEQVNCPFGTKYGEVMAWNRLVRMPQPQAILGGGVM